MKNNTSVTLDINTLLKHRKDFYDEAKRICELEYRPFCVSDFPHLTKNNFRQYIKKLRPLLDVAKPGHPTFYKIKGIEFPGEAHKITFVGMGGERFFEILNSLKLKFTALHDVAIKIDDYKLHDYLLKSGATIDSRNGAFYIDFPQFDPNITTKITVYSRSIMVNLGCTYKPLIYDPRSIWFLHEYLSKVSYHLTSLSNGILFPPVHTWLCIQYHFGKDGKKSLSGDSFQFAFGEVSGGMIRFYSKKMPNGTVIPRLEQIRTNQKSIEDEMKTMLGLNNTNPSDENKFNNNRPCFVTNFPVFCF